MRYGSVCSGIEAASVAWEPLGWEPSWFSEIEAFPSAVLAHRFPGVPNLGDMTTLHEKEEFQRGSVDLLVGGTPCQSFSVAGLRGGLDDPRGNLALVFLRLASVARPRWIVWENVPGVLSSNGGRDFGSFLGALAELGYGWAYRVLDAQHFGVPQRRRRVFVVGCLGDGARAARVLFEPASMRGNPSASRKEEQETPGRFVPRVAYCLETTCNDYSRADGFNMIAQTLTARHDSSPGGGGGYNVVPAAFHATQDPISGPVSPALGTSMYAGVLHQGVRRLTPRECERLQGFPDDWTLVPYRGKPAANGPRYKACGNSMAVPVMRWIGRRIAEAEAES
jgi:DNA (cytosine-5)-methyltransferase 1